MKPDLELSWVSNGQWIAHEAGAVADVASGDDIETMFDTISYDKGASVLRMLRSYLAREVSPQPLMRRSLQQV